MPSTISYQELQEGLEWVKEIGAQSGVKSGVARTAPAVPKKRRPRKNKSVLPGLIKYLAALLSLAFWVLIPWPAKAWHDEVHLAIAQAAGYDHWHLAVGADMAKVKAGAIEQRNHYAYTPPGTVVNRQRVLDQIALYNDPHDQDGHLYGAIIASLRQYKQAVRNGRYAAYHLGFCAHYVGDLSQPLHNTLYNAYNRKHHRSTDGVLNGEVLANLTKIKLYKIDIASEEDLIREVARVANLSLNLGQTLEIENRLLTKSEAYRQISHSASLLKAILLFVHK